MGYLNNSFYFIFTEFDRFMEQYETNIKALLESDSEVTKEKKYDLEQAEQQVAIATYYHLCFITFQEIHFLVLFCVYSCSL